MNRTKIEWADFTVNPVKGYCPVGCDYCYARRMYDRFKWDKTIRFDEQAMWNTRNRQTPSRIFVGSTMELFGDWVPAHWMELILRQVRHTSWHTFIFLTKKPENLAKWNPWPDNAWVGASVTNAEDVIERSYHMTKVDASVRFLSYEPLLDSPLTWDEADWIIIGAQTGPRSIKPKSIWIDTLLWNANRCSIPVFLKDNLHWLEKRQEFPS